ncbi:MAG: methionyl-tRNA formyltransferase [Porticoccaceae bacterium]
MTISSDRLRIVFAGTPEFAAIHLRGILEQTGHKVVAVYTQPDRSAGRGKKLTPSPVKLLAQQHDLPVLQPASLKSSEAQQQLAEFNADIMVVVAYGLLLPKTILDTPRLGCINVHGSLLPRWRGAAPIQRAIEAGDPETGITIMQMDEGLDTGDMLVSAHVTIHPKETSASLHDRLAAIGPDALHIALKELAEGRAVAEKQEDSLSNYAPKISKQEALINWQQSAGQIDRKVRAFNPVPVAYTEIASTTEGQDQTGHKERIRIWSGEPTQNDSSLPAGTIINTDDNGIEVACADYSYRITEMQLSGKNRLPVNEILKSRAALFRQGNRFIHVTSSEDSCSA